MKFKHQIDENGGAVFGVVMTGDELLALAEALLEQVDADDDSPIGKFALSLAAEYKAAVTEITTPGIVRLPTKRAPASRPPRKFLRRRT